MTSRRVPPAYAPVRPLAWAREGDGARGRLAARLRERYGAEDVVLASSGTAALRLAIRAARREARREEGAAPLVGMPAFSCYDVAAAVVAETDRVACFDVDPRTLAPEPASFARVLEAGARVVVVSPLFGVPVPWAELERAADAAGAVLVEDAAQGHGASLEGRPLGSLGRLSILSFARGKGWTGGRGGALLARGGASLSGLDLLPDPTGPDDARLVAGTLGQWALGRPAFYAIPAALPWLGLGETRWRDAQEPAAMADPAARAALASEEAADLEARERRRRAAWLRARVPSAWSVRPPPRAVAGWLRLPLRLPGGAERLTPAARRLGVARAYPEPLTLLPEVRAVLVEAGGPWPGAASLAADLVTLPTHSLLRRSDAEEILRAMEAMARGTPPADGGGSPLPAGGASAGGAR
ncbi:MAG TPA: DegT/DnrJ/EryC1/StrS family aminotransferase [Longimicrobiales bacterium]|nr:DegT/DnrJ/EryC1/StrS family aminotransferase [Longimicrobiales bacterium]